MKYYKLGYYVGGDPSRVFHHEKLKPMTHEEALTMRSKHSNPENVFLYEVKLAPRETPLN